MKRSTHPHCARAVMAGAVLLALGSQSAFSAPTTLGPFGTSTFDMWQSDGTREGRRDANVTGSFDIIAETATIASTRAFSGFRWTAYNINLYGPGTYTVSTVDTTGPAGTTPVSGVGANANITFTVPAGYVGAHMKFAWNTTSGIDVVNLWNAAGTSVRVSDGAVPVITQQDVDGDGILDDVVNPIPGMLMVDGPFAGFSANFNLNPSPASNVAPAVSAQSLTTPPGVAVTWTPTFTDNVDAINDTGTAQCNIVSQPAGGVGRATVASDCSSASFDPQGLADGSTVTFTYRVNDRHFFNNTSTATVTVTVSSTPPPVARDAAMTVNGTTAGTLDLSTYITDGDNNQDLSTLAIATNGSHGTAVSNGDGTVTYSANAGFAGTDTFTYTVSDTGAQTSNAAEVTVTVRASGPSASSGTYTPGSLAASVGSTDGAGLAAADVGTDSGADQQCVGGCFDFEVSGISGSATVVLPLSEPVPAATFYNNRVVYRKLIGGRWQNFDVTGSNAIASAPPVSSNPTVCPNAGSSSYANGLNEGDSCLQVTISDGGPNDADGLVNGTVVDPGGVAVLASITSSVNDPEIGTSGGGGAIGWWTLAGLLGCVGALRFRRRTR